MMRFSLNSLATMNFHSISLSSYLLHFFILRSQCAHIYTYIHKAKCILLIRFATKGFNKLSHYPKNNSPVTIMQYILFCSLLRKLHSDMKTFGCEFCGRHFLDSLRLRMHMLSHSGTLHSHITHHYCTADWDYC